MSTSGQPSSSVPSPKVGTDPRVVTLIYFSEYLMFYILADEQTYTDGSSKEGKAKSVYAEKEVTLMKTKYILLSLLCLK